MQPRVKERTTSPTGTTATSASVRRAAGQAGSHYLSDRAVRPSFPLGEQKPAARERRHLSGPAAPSTAPPQRSRRERARAPHPVKAALPQVTRVAAAG